ncbi:dCTP deaminase [Methanogenium marinum]|uniref:dCTP deaminase n=1 Tax=Methanogenium marinum TaxID=348610 RepID=A0A9Q4KUZ2_9EURY|nr:dCTP deaminase [Methanogenium marinum]MDE4907845.1 dCTP deaminase [Methanogenium marinum]
MILSESDIGERIASGNLVITPYSKDSQQPASYDLRSAEDYLLSKGECTLVASMERVELPCDVAATLMCRSSFGRRGVLIGGGFVDPGFRGQLTLCLVNVGPEDITLPAGERVVQIIMHEVKTGAREYEGRYQDSNGAVSCR